MATLNGFDANAVDPMGDFEPIPAGDYLAVIVGSEVKPTKDGKGGYLSVEFDVIDGQYKGRKLWSRLNLDNESEKAVQIARSELSSICRAVNVMQPKDSCELHNIPLIIKVKCKKREDNGEMTNEIKGYAKRDGQSTTAPPPAADDKTPPWKRKSA